MSYKCAIFGHKYGEVEVDRERTEEGDEVVVTVRETETCKRCGNTRVVSENKEVRTMETAADIVADDLDEERADAPASDQSEPQPTPTEAVEEVAQEPSTGDGVTSDAVDPEEDDAVILDDEESTREEGEWPEEAEQDSSEPETGWPEKEGEDSEEPSWELDDEIDPHPETEQSGSSESGTLTIPEGQFYCPNCEFTTPVESSSLRAGDFCPECHKGALEHSSE